MLKVLDNTNLTRSQLQYKETDHKAIILNRGTPIEEMFLREIWKDDYYFYKIPFPTKADSVLDIGGHIGSFSILVAKYCNAVVAYEPLIENVDLFKQNIELNGCGNVIIEPFAISDKNAVATINIQGDEIKDLNSGRSIISSDRMEGHVTRIIDTVDINTVLNSYDFKFTYIKLDCEGSEYQILPALDFKRFPEIRYITMEFHISLEEGYKIKELLEANNFEVFLSYAYGQQGRITARKQ